MTFPDKPANMDVQEEGDITVVRIQGDYTLAVERYMQAIREDLEDRYGYRLVLIQVDKIGTITNDARRALVQWNRGGKAPGAVALVGASFATNTLARMVLSAARILTKRDLEFDFFGSEAQARAWLSERRERMRERARPRPER